MTSHARVLLCIAHDPGVRLRDIAATDKIIIARVGPAGQTWRAPRHCLQDESLRRAIEALRSRQARTASVLRLLDVAL